MEDVKLFTIGILAALCFTVGVFFGIDAEVARRDYNENVKQCKAIDGCLFSYNCRKYNKMIEEACND